MLALKRSLLQLSGHSVQEASILAYVDIYLEKVMILFVHLRKGFEEGACNKGAM
jgi:hypothetical protein